ncbi:MAG: T9SS type A sorting domain-containing protein [bacterium]
MILILVLVAEINIQPYYFTNTNYYYEIISQDSVIYGATNGGIIAYNRQSRDFQVLTNTDGLQLNRQNCLGLDSTGFIWVGNASGLALVDNNFSEIRIYPAEHLTGTNTQDIACLRDSIFIGSADGLLFNNTMGTPDDFSDDVRMKIREPEGLPSKNVLTIALDDTSIWVGTDNGLVRFSKDFSVFEQYSTVHGLLSNHINKIFIKDTSIYIATNMGLNSFQGTYFDTLLTGEYISDVTQLGDSLVLAMDSISQVGIFYQGNLSVINNGIPYLCKVNSLLNMHGEIFCGLGNRYARDHFGEGLGRYSISNNIWELTNNNCLPSNHISDITANEHGIFVACGSRASDSRGFAWFDSAATWTNFLSDSIIPSNRVHRCETAPDGKVWCAMNAFPDIAASVMAFSLDPGLDEWEFMYNGYHGIDGTVAVWDIKFDTNNNMFVALAGSSDKVWVIDSARDEVYFLDTQSGFVVEMALDSEGKIWRTFVTDNKTLLMIDTQNTLFDRSDDSYGDFSTADGLLSNYAYGCAVDSDNNLYVANESGLAIYDGVDFSIVSNVSSGELLDVELDSEGRVWVMARDGIYYYDPIQNIIDGWRYYEIGVNIEFLAFSNELIQVQGFEFDPLRGCFWLAGETGLLKIAVENDTVSQLDSILIYPNPVLGTGVLRIKHLPQDALVNIYAISGRLLIDDLEPDHVFGEVVWEIPEDIGSGLYFVLVRSHLYGNKVCKFAIVR